MDIQRMFEVLGIGETKDENQIKAAYRSKLVDVNPEDNPEGFKRLREAYEGALAYAAKQEKEAVKDDPVSLYLQRLDDLYRSLSGRLDAGQWEELLAEELLADLDLGEDAKWGTFDYLADHYRVPAYIWRILDRVFDLKKNEQEFKEHLPENFVDFMLWKITEDGAGGEFPYTKFTGADTADYDEFIRNYDILCRMMNSESEYENREDWLKDIGEKIAGMDSFGISHPWYELEKAKYALALGQKEEAEQTVRMLWEEGEKDDHLLVGGAKLLSACGQEKDSEEVYRTFLEREDALDDDVYSASLGMAEICYRREEWVDARDHALAARRIYNTQIANDWCFTCNERLIDFYTQESTEELTIEEGVRLAWCYIQTDRGVEGLGYFREHPILTEDTADCHRVKTILYMVSNQAEEAQKAVEEARLWRKCLLQESEEDIYLVAQSYEIEGKSLVTCYREKEEGSKEAEELKAAALTAFDEAVSRQPDNINILMSKMLFMRELKDYETMAELCEKMQVIDAGYFWAHFYAQEAYEALGKAQEVVDSFYRAKEIYAGRPEIYERAAGVFLYYEQYGNAQNIIEQADAEGVSSAYLKVRKLELMRNAAEDTEALRAADTYAEQIIEELEESQSDVKQLAEAYMQRMYIHNTAKEFQLVDKMEEWGNKAVTLDDSDWNRYYLGRFYVLYRDDAKTAYEHLKICEERGMEFVWLYYFIAQCHEGFEQWDDAIVYYKKGKERAPEESEFGWRIAWLYRQKFTRTRQWEYCEEALRYLDEHVEKFGENARELWQLSDLHSRTMEYEKALAEIERALETDGQCRNWGHKGMLLEFLGRSEEAVECYEKGIEVKSDYGYAYSQMYDYFCEKKLMEEGIQWFEAKMDLLQNEERKKKNLCYIKYLYCMLRNWEKALETVERAYGGISLAVSVCDSWEKEGERISELLEVYQFYLTDAELEEKAKEAAALLEGETGAALEESHEGKRKAYMEIAHTYADMLKVEKALPYYQKALEEAQLEGTETDDCRDALDCMMRCLWHMGKEEQAKQYAKQYMEYLSEQYKECEELGKSVEELHANACHKGRYTLYHLFIVSFFGGDYELADKYTKQMENCGWCWNCSRKECSEEWECKGYMAMVKGDKEEAIACFERALACVSRDNYDARRELRRLRE